MNGLKKQNSWLGSQQAILRLYQNLYREDKFQKNSAAYDRMKQIEKRIIKGGRNASKYTR